MRVRVLTLNIWNMAGDPRRAELINEELRRLDPDLVSLQEVPDPTGYDRLDRILAGTGLHRTDQSGIPQETAPGTERYGGNAVATRRPHRLCEALDLRLADAPDVRWLTLAVSVPVPGVGELLFIATTTSWRLDAEAARERQARYLTGKQSLAGRSVHYHDAWAVAGDGPGHTWTADNVNVRSTTDDAGRTIDKYAGQPNHQRRIDYVFVGSEPAHPGAYARISSAARCFDKPTDGLWPSDHFGVVVDLDIGSRP